MKKLSIMLGLALATLFVGASSASAQSFDVRFGSGGYYGHRNGGVSIDIRIGDRDRCDHRGSYCNHGGYRNDRDRCDHRGSYCNHGGYRNDRCDHRGSYCNHGGYRNDRCDHRGSYCTHGGYRGGDYRGGRDCNDGCGDYNRPASVQVWVTDCEPIYDRCGRYVGERRTQRRVTAYWNPRVRAYTYIDRRGREVIADVRW